MIAVKRAAGVACLLGALLASTSAWAQSAIQPQAGVLPTPEQLNPAQQPQARPPAARDNDLMAPPERGSCPLSQSTLTFKLTSVEITGSTAVRAPEMAAAYGGMIGQTIPVSALCEIRDRASNIMFRHGILARVEIPEQHIAEGKVVFRVVEARIASVRVRGNAGPSQAKVEEYIERLRGLAPFDLATAQRYLLLASDVPGVRVSAALLPSGQGLGAVDMEVTVDHQAYDLIGNVTNYGSQSLGPWGALIRGDINGLTPFGDRTTVVLYSTTDGLQQRVAQLVEEIRPGSDGWLARASIAYGQTRPGGEEAQLDLHGSSLVASLQAAYPLLRGRGLTLNLTGGFDFVDQNTAYGNGGGVLSDDHLRILYGRASTDLHQRFDGIPFDFQGGVEVRKGVDALGASRVGADSLSRFDGRSDAWVFRSDGQFDVQWLRHFATRVGFQAQYTDSVLLAYDELQVGNLTIGRGYDPSVIEGDRGVAGSVEARFPNIQPVRWASFEPYGFYDIAYVQTLGVDGTIRVARSIGGGVRLRVTQRVGVDVFYAEPLDKITPEATSKPPSRVMVSLVTTFF